MCESEKIFIDHMVSKKKKGDFDVFNDQTDTKNKIEDNDNMEDVYEESNIDEINQEKEVQKSELKNDDNVIPNLDYKLTYLDNIPDNLYEYISSNYNLIVKKTQAPKNSKI